MRVAIRREEEGLEGSGGLQDRPEGKNRSKISRVRLTVIIVVAP